MERDEQTIFYAFCLDYCIVLNAKLDSTKNECLRTVDMEENAKVSEHEIYKPESVEETVRKTKKQKIWIQRQVKIN